MRIKVKNFNGYFVVLTIEKLVFNSYEKKIYLYKNNNKCGYVFCRDINNISDFEKLAKEISDAILQNGYVDLSGEKYGLSSRGD